MMAKFAWCAYLCYDEAGSLAGIEIHNRCEKGEDVVSSVTAEHPGAHHQALARGLTRVPIEIPQTIPPASGQKH